MYQLLSVSYDEAKDLLESIKYIQEDSNPGIEILKLSDDESLIDKPIVKIKRDETLEKVAVRTNSIDEILPYRFGRQLAFDTNYLDVIEGEFMIVNFIKVSFNDGNDFALVEKIDVKRDMKHFSASIGAIIDKICPDVGIIYTINVIETELSQYELNILMIEGDDLLSDGVEGILRKEYKYDGFRRTFNDLVRFLYTNNREYQPFKIERKGFK